MINAKKKTIVADMVMAESVWYVCTKFHSSLKSQEISGCIPWEQWIILCSFFVGTK